ncbi:signal recognition particle-docking protein FtsY [Chloroflexota bacterium]
MFNPFRKTEKGVKKTRQAWWGKMGGLFKRSSLDEELWSELEESLIIADVGVGTTQKLIDVLKGRVKDEKIVEAVQVETALKEEMSAILGSAPQARSDWSGDGFKVILIVGVNGVGKTTSIAKLASHLKGQGRRVLLAAGDTFRAAAIDQLKLWGKRIGVDVIAHQPGGDPGAVVFDALEAARKRGADILIVDTAGRLHTKSNLMEELKKIRRIVGRVDESPEVLLVLDATTGQNGLSQARYFTEAVSVTGILLAKLDSTAKGGIVLAICDELKLPIAFIGTGQEADDLALFVAEDFVAALFSHDDD